MPHARGYPCKSGVWWYVIPDARHGRPIPCGKGAKGKRLATRSAARANELKYQQQAGIEMPRECIWTLEDLHVADIQAAKDRGLRTARPQLSGRRGGKSRRESHWKALIAFFGEATNLDEITQGRVLAYMGARKRGPSATNRDLDVLRGALRLARETDEAGYSGDPFRGVRRLDERGSRRKPIALPEKETRRVVRALWREDPRLGAYSELLYETCSRLSQVPAIAGRFLRYDPQKRGNPRAFFLASRTRLEGRPLGALARLPRLFDRKAWRRGVKLAGHPTLNPHDLRHSRLTVEGGLPKASLSRLMEISGVKSPEVIAVYLHPSGKPIRIDRRGAVGKSRKQPSGNRVPRGTSPK